MTRKLSTASVTEVPAVGAVTTSSATIVFRTNESASVYVMYADNKNMNGEKQTSSIITVAGDDFTGSITITNLTTATKYWYRVYVDDQMHDPGTIQKFETFPDAGSTFRFSIFSDSAKYTAGRRANVYQYGSASPNFDDALFAAQIGDFDHSDPTNLSELRVMHRALRDIDATSGEDFATHIISKMALVHVWDDHDVSEHNLAYVTVVCLFAMEVVYLVLDLMTVLCRFLLSLFHICACHMYSIVAMIPMETVPSKLMLCKHLTSIIQRILVQIHLVGSITALLLEMLRFSCWISDMNDLPIVKLMG